MLFFDICKFICTFSCVCEKLFVILHPKFVQEMKLILILLSVMSFTVETKYSVKGDGLFPYDIEIAYSNTGTKGNVGKDDVATLTLGNLGGITVEKIEVWMNSNKNAGAGTFSVKANSQTIATKEGTFKDWTGAYDNSAWHAISLLTTPRDGVDELEISLTGTANSLHIDEYEITYAPRPAHSVTLMKGDTEVDILTEEHGMSGVLLPKLEDEGYWKFRGWSTTEFWEVKDKPAFLASGKTYYPEQDCTLWTVYQYDDSPEMVYASDLVSGDYRYHNAGNEMVMAGLPDNGVMVPAMLDLNDPNQVYHVDFLSLTTATITHKSSGQPIGFSGTDLTITHSVWSVFHHEDKTLFYTTINGKTYVLFMNVYDTSSQSIVTKLVQTNLQAVDVGLLPVPIAHEPVYTCHPEMTIGINEVEESEKGQGKVVMHFGPYTLWIQNGKKYLMKE